MFGTRFFGPRYWGRRYFGVGGDTPPAGADHRTLYAAAATRKPSSSPSEIDPKQTVAVRK